MRLLGSALALVLGAAAGVSAVAVHRTFPGLVLAAGSAMAALWALRQWRTRLAGWFAVGWLAALGVALAGRSEGDLAVSGDTFGYLLVGTGFAVLVVGVASLAVHDAGPGGHPT